MYEAKFPVFFHEASSLSHPFMYKEGTKVVGFFTPRPRGQVEDPSIHLLQRYEPEANGLEPWIAGCHFLQRFSFGKR